MGHSNVRESYSLELNDKHWNDFNKWEIEMTRFFLGFLCYEKKQAQQKPMFLIMTNSETISLNIISVETIFADILPVTV